MTVRRGCRLSREGKKHEIQIHEFRGLRLAASRRRGSTCLGCRSIDRRAIRGRGRNAMANGAKLSQRLSAWEPAGHEPKLCACLAEPTHWEKKKKERVGG